jgi:hypothetical protein
MKPKNIFFVLGIVFCVSMTYAQVTGSGTPNTIPIWTATTNLGNSSIFQKGANIGIGTKAPTAKLEVDLVAASGNGVFAHATSKVTGAAGIGVYGQADGSNGTGVFGHATTGAGNTSAGVAGQVDSNGGASGVYGHGAATTGVANGVFGQTDAPVGTGLFGYATSTTGNANALDAVVNSPNATAAWIQNTASGQLIVGAVGFSNTAVFRVDGTGKGFFDGGTQTGGADFAESVAVAKEVTHHEAGDLLIVDATGKRQLKLSWEPYSTLVAGIYSTKPGVLATPHRMDEIAANEIPLAIVGIVPCKVSAENGPIQPGDLLVTSATPGHAMRGTDRNRMLGAVVGKALEPLSEGKGVIQVLVTLQ